MVKCRLIPAESQERQNKREILARLASHMVVEEVSLSRMLHLVQECKFEGGKYGQIEDEGDGGGTFLASLTRGLLPGTLWCGVDDQAKGDYTALGDLWRLDACCRAHDHCPVKVKAFQQR